MNDELVVEVPYKELSAAALRGIIEYFVLREGTDYGPSHYSLEEKVADVRKQLETGRAKIMFHPAEGQCTIVRS
ncbi:MAG: YheU family protein [Oligoflexia bacterium]|nr:YheU family protein [Oligoflexia bacterium]